MFTDEGNGNTRIVHRSYFRSNSRLRDAILYPFFHKRIVNRFHRNMLGGPGGLTAGME
jgi:hypothetical protein